MAVLVGLRRHLPLLACRRATVPRSAVKYAADHRAQETNKAYNAAGVAEEQYAHYGARHALDVTKHLHSATTASMT